MKALLRNPKAEGRNAAEDRNPKTEGRRPKEGRNPKFESDFAQGQSEMDTSFWLWGDEPDRNALVVREDGLVRPLQPLDERTVLFGEAIIQFAKRVPRNPINDRLISQLIGAGTSVGANYCEADDSVSGKEFKQKIGICRKESKETMFFLRMISTSEPDLTPEARRLWREAKELNLIFGAIWRK
jgi:four helix bundle protein